MSKKKFFTVFLLGATVVLFIFKAETEYQNLEQKWALAFGYSVLAPWILGVVVGLLVGLLRLGWAKIRKSDYSFVAAFGTAVLWVAGITLFSGAILGFLPNPSNPAPTQWLRTLLQGTADTFRDCADCPEMVVVPAGSFVMGSGEQERRWVFEALAKVPQNERSFWETPMGLELENEGPRHRVNIPTPLAVGKYEVTVAQWLSCMGCRGHLPDDEVSGIIKGFAAAKRPVVNVNWHDAKAYVAWLSRKTGRHYRLLSEAEWEYVARAGTKTPFHTGDRITADQANFDGNYTYNGSAKGEYRQRSTSVGTFAPNAFGLHDVHGNVYEWVEDCWHDNYHGAPGDGSAWTTGDDCSSRVVRGGIWDDGPWSLRSAFRLNGWAEIRSEGIGFRVARTLSR